MSICFAIPDEILKKLRDKHSLKISNHIRNRRNQIRRFLAGLFKGSITGLSVVLDRKSYTCDNGTQLPGRLLADEVMTSQDERIREAHSGARVVYDFYRRVLGRNSLDDKGMTLISSVHYDKNYNNAFFDGAQMVYGDGDGKYFLPLTKDLSVIAHEDSHCLVQETCGLVYYGQSGAGNESYADKFGIAVEHWHFGASDPKLANWFLGDEIVGSEFPGKGLRSFTKEPAYQGENNPRHMKQFKRMFADNGGVHINSSILNHAFYLYCVGLNEPSYGKPIQIALRALSKLGKWSNFKAIAKAEIQSAKELYGDDAAKIVASAYKQVGINA